MKNFKYQIINKLLISEKFLGAKKATGEGHRNAITIISKD